MLWTEYRPVIKIGPEGALGSHELSPIHSSPSLGQSIGKYRQNEILHWYDELLTESDSV